MIQSIVERQKERANDNNYTLALLLPAFSTQAALPIDFLPYPPPKTTLDPETARAVAKLLREEKLNRKTVGILGGLGLLAGLPKLAAAE
jgi:hypothetical protein